MVFTQKVSTMTVPLSIQADLNILYSQTHRHYHDNKHIMHCLRELEEVPAVLLTNTDKEILEWALWFHDAVYDPKSKKNEENSASLFLNTVLTAPKLVSLSEDDVEEVYQLILSTAHFNPQTNQTGAGTQRPIHHLRRAYMLDIDFAILGQEFQTYKDYYQDIRTEYWFVPLKNFAVVRSTILSGWLAQPTIFRTKYFQEKYEAQARQNIKFELEFLAKGSNPNEEW